MCYHKYVSNHKDKKTKEIKMASSATYTVTLTTASTGYTTTVTTASSDNDFIIDLAIERIKEEDGFDLSQHRFVDTDVEVLEVWD